MSVYPSWMRTQPNTIFYFWYSAITLTLALAAGINCEAQVINMSNSKAHSYHMEPLMPSAAEMI